METIRDFFVHENWAFAKYALSLTLDKKDAKYIVDLLELNYTANSNPFYAWHALFQCEFAEIPRPVWIEGYLVDCALKLYTLVEMGKDRRLERDISESFGFTQKGKQQGALKHYLRFAKVFDFLLRSRVVARHAKNKSQVIREVSEKMGISIETGWSYARRLEAGNCSFWPPEAKGDLPEKP